MVTKYHGNGGYDMKKRILVPGGTGAMGVYLVPELLKKGYAVDVVSLDDKVSDIEDLRYFKDDFTDIPTAKKYLSNGYDAVVDFMIYNSTKFDDRYEMFLSSTSHYIYLSTYRIYAGEHPITEESPRLLDVSDDEKFLSTDDYSLYKAKGENLLKNSGKNNWTIIRPAVTYSKRRFQLTTLEMPLVVGRALESKLVLLPEGAADCEATMSWAGDVARMIAAIVLNPSAMGETYTVSTSEHHTWREIAEIYHELIGLNYRFIPDEDFVKVVSGGSDAARYQLIYDRCFDRVIDNSKILALMGEKQEDLMPLREGLALELSSVPKNLTYDSWYMEKNARIDEYILKNGLK